MTLSRAPLGVLMLALIVTVGCGRLCPLGLGCRPSVQVTVEGSDDMNLGQAATVVVVQLAGSAEFQQTPVERFWTDAAGSLRADVVDRKRNLLLFPGESVGLDVPLHDDARFIGVAANLRHPHTDQWRSRVAVDDLDGRAAVIRIESRRLTVALR